MVQVPAHLAKFASKFKSAEQFTMPVGQAFPRIKIDKGFMAVDAEGEETFLGRDSFEFVTIASNPATSKIHYAGDWAPGVDSPPDCFSDNGFYPDVRASNPHCESCALCEFNRWGSAKSNMTGGDVKACSDNKKLAIEPLHDDVTGVHLLRVGPGALKNWAKYLNELRKIGAECGFVADLTPDLVITKVFWADTNVMGFEFVDFLDEELCNYVAERKETNEHESWIGLDSQSQSYPMIASLPRAEQQRLAAPAKQPEPEPVDAEVIEGKSKSKFTRTATAKRGLLEKTDEPVPGKARAEAQALGAKQGERKLNPVEIAKQRARERMNRPSA